MSESQVSHSLIGVKDLGVMRYAEALAEQESIHKSVIDGGRATILSVQHPAVLTLGKNATLANLLFSKDFYQKQGIDFFETERGGEVTAHELGQLVVYPILPILQLGLNARSYVDILESSVIDVLASYGISAARDSEYPGVWIGHEKICAIGVRIKSRVSMHGLALNVNNSLDLFGKIIPCGIKMRGVTTMQKILGTPIDLDQVRLEVISRLLKLISERKSVD